MSYNVLVEAFGSIVNEELQSEGVSLETVVRDGLEEIDLLIGLDSVDKIITGMNGDVTFALQDIVDEVGYDVEVSAFYPNVNRIAEEDDIEYQEAWKKGFTWRNNKVFTDAEDDDTDTVDVCVRLGDAGNNGQALLQHARRKGVPAIDINLDHCIDRDAAYGGGQAADADASAEDEAQA